MAEIITLNKNKAGILLLKQIVETPKPISGFLGIVSINDPGSSPADGVEYFHKRHEKNVLILYFYDVDSYKHKKLNHSETKPTEEDVQKIIDYGKQYMHDNGLLFFHCHAGQSRSTAATYILYLIKHGPGKERHAWDRMVECSQSNYWPNMDMLKLAQKLLPEYNLMPIAEEHHMKKIREHNKI